MQTREVTQDIVICPTKLMENIQVIKPRQIIGAFKIIKVTKAIHISYSGNKGLAILTATRLVINQMKVERLFSIPRLLRPCRT